MTIDLSTLNRVRYAILEVRSSLNNDDRYKSETALLTKANEEITKECGSYDGAGSEIGCELFNMAEK